MVITNPRRQEMVIDSGWVTQENVVVHGGNIRTIMTMKLTLNPGSGYKWRISVDGALSQSQEFTVASGMPGLYLPLESP